MGGGLGEGWLEIDLGRGSADDGKRCSSAGRLLVRKIMLRERGSGRGDTIAGPDSNPGGFLNRSFFNDSFL